MMEDARFRREDFHELLGERDLSVTHDVNGYVDPWSDIAWISWKRAISTEPVQLPMPQQSGEYITLIRDLRQATGCTLKAAKEAIDDCDSDYAAALLLIQDWQQAHPEGGNTGHTEDDNHAVHQQNDGHPEHDPVVHASHDAHQAEAGAYAEPTVHAEQDGHEHPGSEQPADYSVSESHDNSGELYPAFADDDVSIARPHVPHVPLTKGF